MLSALAFVFAATPMKVPVQASDPSIEARIDELDSESAKKRRLAAFALRRMTRQYTRIADREHGDEVAILEARQALMVFDDELARTCIDRIAVRNLTGLCADILRLLGSAQAEAPLEEQLAREDRRCVERRIEKALEAIRAP
jgi:hypothetical protein